MANPKDYTKPYFDLTTGIPKHLRNPVNTALMDTLFNRFMTEDEAVPLYGYIGRPPSDPDDKTPKIPQSSVERDINALIPVLSFKTGTEVHSFTAQDLIRKAEVLGISSNKAQWLYSQGNNYAPPISLQKFTNFYNFYWVANAVPNPPEFSWNPENAPEYYTIQRPSLSDIDKLNVKTSTNTSVILTGSGFNEPVWELLFSDPVTATLKPIGPGYPSTAVLNISLTGENEFNKEVSFVYQGKELIRLNILRDTFLDADGNIGGRESFLAGDKFTITAPFISRTTGVQFTGNAGVKGKLTGIKSLSEYQVINSVQLRENDRVLVKDQGDQTQNGVYVVKANTWVRSEDMSVVSPGQRVYDTSTNTLYESGVNNKFTAITGSSNTNDWQESNFWRSKEEIQILGLDPAKIVQATRPIIEYESGIELNSYVQNNMPSNVGTSYTQRKSEFNQAPLFNLYRYDGTHANLASSIFFYVQDPTSEVDIQLQRRLKKANNGSNDFLFGHGLIEGDSLLFYKKLGKLKTIWEPGYTAPKFDPLVDLVKSAYGNGDIAVEILDPFIGQQIFTLTALTSSTFELTGSKNKVFPDNLKYVHTDTDYQNLLLKIRINTGSISFQPGDSFIFRVGNFESTRYVYRDNDNQIFDLYGGEALDINKTGTWQVPRMFYNNIGADNGKELPEGTLYSHFRGIIANQVPGMPEDKSFGGSIKLWSEQQNLLASLLMQRDLTVPSIIELAQRQYETGINAVNEIFLKNYLIYLTQHGAVNTDQEIETFLEYLLDIRKKDHDVKQVLFDSTAGVPGFPATLPQLGVIPLSQPSVIFDPELGATLLRRHDGSLSPLNEDSSDFRDRLFSVISKIKRSDGTETLAVSSFTNTPNARPYKGELWILPTSYTDIRVFNVLSDTNIAPTNAKNGDFWYNRPSNIFSKLVNGFWVPGNIQDAWVKTNPAELLNVIQLKIEQRLYAGISPVQRTYFNTTEVTHALSGKLKAELKRELNSWAASNNYDAFAPDYNSSDAFTWNYSSTPKSLFSALTGPTPARWFNVLKNHQSTISDTQALIIPTARPHLEPWKLLGLSGQAAQSFIAQYKSVITPAQAEDSRNGFILGDIVKVVSYASTLVVTSLSGLPIVDGIQLTAGDRVLLASELSEANAGVWSVSAGIWTKIAKLDKTIVSVQDGNTRAGTHWLLTVTGNNTKISQVREWKEEMWAVIQAARPGLKLSVDTSKDALLPPYVNAVLPFSVNALSTALPLNITKRYEFGESSPVETIWKKSIEYRYSLAKALFRYDPLGFLGHCWGIEWIKASDADILYDGFDVTVPGHTRFRLHGENIQKVERSLENTIFSSTMTGPGNIHLLITRDGFTDTRGHAFSVRTNSGTLLGTLIQGINSNISSNGYNIDILIKDNGKPFRVGDQFEITANANGTGRTIVFTPARYAIFNGFGQIFAQALREGNIDNTIGYAVQAYRNWSVNLGYRAGGLVSTDDLKVFTDQAALPSSSFDLRFNKSSYTKNIWAQALRIQVSQFGKFIPNQYLNNIPSQKAEDWIFRIEGYNSRFLDIEYYSLDTSSNFTTFNILDQTHDTQEWKHFQHVNGLINQQLPFTITGLQNVINFLFGYAQRLEDLGWRFSDTQAGNTDASTGRIRGWQLEVEKFIDAVYTGVELGQGQVLNPFMDRIWLNQPTGLLSKFTDTTLFDVVSHAGVFDVLGTKIDTSDLTIIRTKEQSQISANMPMFSVHAQLDEFEHLFVFNNLSSPSTGEGLIYDPFSGARIVTIKLNGRKQASTTLRPEFGGHYLVGNEVKRNLKSSTDKIAGYYDTDKVFEDELSTRHALALLGFTPKTYMSDLDLNERTQFNFWRGLVQMKGTNASIDAFLNNERFKNAQIDEYWAYKVAEFGDARSKVYPELRLNTTDTLQQFTKLQFDADEVTGGANPPLIDFQQIYSDDEERWFSIDDLNQDTRFESKIVGSYHKVGGIINELYELPFIADKLVGTGFIQLNAKTIKCTNSVINITGYGPAAPKFSPVKLFNYVDKELIEEISIWHPAAGQHNTAAISAINITATTDPARYNVSTLVAGNANYDPLRTWGAKELGRVWWDNTELAYIPYYDQFIFNSVDERLSRWGSQTDYSQVNVAEWIESAVPPALYNAQANIDAGNADLDTNTRADGLVHGAKTYVRDRQWSTRPIAWSKAGVAIEAAHPSFAGSFFDTLYFLNESGTLKVSLESTSFKQLGINPGMRLGAWQQPDALTPGYATRPLSEYTVLDNFSKVYQGLSLPVNFTGALTGSIDIKTHQHTEVLGDLLFIAPTMTATEVLDSQGFGTGIYDVSSYLEVKAVDAGISDLVLIRTDRAIGSSAISAKPAHQEVIFNAVKTGESNTGLADLVQYQLLVTVNGVSTPIQVYGELNKTFNDLVSSINAVLSTADLELINGGLTFSTTSTGITSTIQVSGDLLTSLYDFKRISPAVSGSAAKPAVSPLSTAIFAVNTGDKFEYVLPNIGSLITVSVSTTGSVSTNAISQAIATKLSGNLSMRDAVQVVEVCPLSDPDKAIPNPNILPGLANDPTDAEYQANAGIGWRAWSVPSQQELDLDSKLPDSIWKPYVGAWIDIQPSSNVIASTIPDLKLLNGTVVNRFNTSWGIWSELKTIKLNKTSEVDGNLNFTLPIGSTNDRVSVYVNGVARLIGTYRIIGSILEVQNVPKFAEVVILIRAYSPNIEELAFNPTVLDNLTVQRQYKIDYQYVEIPIRDSEGTILSTKYYFWVKNRSIQARKKDLSVKSIAELLSNGPSQFLTFQNMNNNFTYDAITIAGLSYVVTKDDTFKLRFTRNFTLRDDSQELDLKDTHTEWALIRPNQRTKIPVQLWQKLVDTACGQDAAGNKLPSPRRAAYDARHNTKTQFGFGADQVLAPTELVQNTLLFSILNTALVQETDIGHVPDYMSFLDFDQADSWFESSESIRNILTRIWNEARAVQVNELFFNVLEDILASNMELSDIFKTSRLNAYSTTVVKTVSATQQYE